MTTKFYALLTNTGAAKFANAAALGTKIQITEMAVGDGGGTLPTPDASQTKLIGEKRRAALNSLSVDAVNSSQIIAEQVIPENEGGFWIREIGLFDADGDMVAVANCAETYKPQLQEGSGRTQTVRMILIVNSAATVTLKIDPSVVLATRKYVDDKAIEVRAYADEVMKTHLAQKNPHAQYLQIASALAEIKDAGLVADVLKNLGLGEAAKRDVGTGLNQIQDMSSFGGKRGGAGYKQHPSGLIEVGGSVGVNGSAQTQKITVNYPIPFPSICLGIWFSFQ
ncbi:phage tail protein, partial [Mixta sp.]|uniref:phage tail protein n=1 Tax=Mixta sp. TaxID=2100765 RepID=UPI00258A1349